MRNKKIEMAEQLLISTTMTIEAISFEVGYENTSHFIDAFKNLRGTTPARYRLGKSQ